MNTLTSDFTKWSNLFTHAEWQEDYSICLTFKEYVTYKKAWVAYAIEADQAAQMAQEQETEWAREWAEAQAKWGNSDSQGHECGACFQCNIGECQACYYGICETHPGGML